MSGGQGIYETVFSHIMASVYFGWIDKNWLWLYVFYLVVILAIPFTLLFVSEAPKHLYEK